MVWNFINKTKILSIALNGSTYYFRFPYFFTAVPNPTVGPVTFTKAKEQPDADPPTFSLPFDVSIAPPTTVNCQVENISLDVIGMSCVVLDPTYSLYTPQVATNVTLKSRIAAWRLSMPCFSL